MSEANVPTFFPGWELAARRGDAICLRSAADDTSTVTLAQVAPEIFALNVDIHQPTLGVDYPQTEGVLILNWCVEGRCEVDLGDHGSCVVQAHDLCLSSRSALAFSYPTADYQGFEVLVNLPQLPAQINQTTTSIAGISLAQLTERVSAAGAVVLTTPARTLEASLLQASRELAEDEVSVFDLRLALMQLLRTLATLDLSGEQLRQSYLQRGQRDLAHELHDVIVAHPEAPFSLEEAAVHMGVAASSLRRYFSVVYGTTPSAFAHEYAMHHARELLRDSTMSVADIALATGYLNPSKFSAAFKRATGANPLDYRRRSRAGMLSQAVEHSHTEEEDL